MRLFIVTVSLLVLGLASLAAAQGGIFDTIRSFFGAPSRPARRPAQPQPQQQQVNLNENPSEGQRFVRQNRPNSFNNNFNARPQGNVQTRFRPQGFSAQRQPAQQQQQTAQAQNDRCAAPRDVNEPLTSCPKLAVDEVFDNKQIVYTWKDERCKKFTAGQAARYCREIMGGEPVSLDSNFRAEYFLKKAADFGQRYYWTGGRLNHECQRLYWPSGNLEGFGTPGTRYWSPVGG